MEGPERMEMIIWGNNVQFVPFLLIDSKHNKKLNWGDHIYERLNWNCLLRVQNDDIVCKEPNYHFEWWEFHVKTNNWQRAIESIDCPLINQPILTRIKTGIKPTETLFSYAHLPDYLQIFVIVNGLNLRPMTSYFIVINWWPQLLDQVCVNVQSPRNSRSKVLLHMG